MGIRTSMGVVILAGLFCYGVPCFAAADRNTLLTEPGIYGTFATFRLDDAWMKQDQATRIGQLARLKGVVEQHREHIAVDLYLMRGLSDYADLMFRLHASELRETQRFLVDLQSTAFGKHLKEVGLAHGLTKKPHYVPGFSDQLKTDLNESVDVGPKPYAIVVPVRKSAEWWSLDHDTQAAMIREHTEAALPYIKTVKRKLYHASGLDDLDFITYFETSKLEDFHSLIRSLEQVKEFQYLRRFGHPILIGTPKSVDELIEILAQ